MSFAVNEHIGLAESAARRNRQRLAALRATKLLDSTPCANFDRITRLAASLLGAPATFISLVDENRDFHLSQFGLPEPLASERVLRGFTLGEFVVGRGETVSIADINSSAAFHAAAEVSDAGVAAFIGVPITVGGGITLGSFNAVDTRPRQWTAEDVQVAEDFAALIGSEITLRSEATQRILDTSKSAAILDAALGGILQIDSGGICVFVNPEGARMLGYTPSELFGTNIPALVRRSAPPDECPMIQCCIDGAAIHIDEDVFWAKDGSPVAVEFACAPILAESGQFDAVVTFRDISGRKAIQEAQKLRDEQSELTRHIIEATSDAFIATDEQGRIRQWNSAACRMFGWTAEQAMGNSVYSLIIPGEFHSLYRQAILDFRSGSENGILSRRFDGIAMRSNGEEFPAEVTVTGFRSQSEFVLTAFVHDATLKKRLTEKHRHSQKMEAIGTLAAGIAHDFNNILTVIRMNAECLKGDLDGSPLSSDLGEIIVATEKAQALTRQLLAYGRRQVLDPQTINVNEIVTDVVRMLRRLIPPNIAINAAMGEDMACVSVDPGQIEQVVTNLVLNARDAMPRGGEIALETRNVLLHSDECDRHRTVPPGAYVLVTIRDTGEGMDDATLERVFDPFFTTKELGKGTGLGLSTAYGIIKQSRGEILLNSSRGAGTRIRIFLPAIEVPCAVSLT